MFPIRDHNPSRRRPLVTQGLIAVNIVMFLLTLPMVAGGEWLWLQLALYPLAVTHGEAMTGMVSHMFLHAGLLHIAGNMLFLWIFGDNLEDQMGHAGFLLFYLACGLAAATAQIATEPFSPVPMVGASGAIAGVMGGYVLLFPRARVDVALILIFLIRVITVPAWLILGLWFSLQLLGGINMAQGQGGVAYWAHAGGFAAGIILTLPLFFRRGGPGFWRRSHGLPPHPETRYTASRIPRVRR